jgi:hypothetical protein
MTGPDYAALYREWYSRIEQAYTRLGHPFGFNPPIVCSVRSFEAVPRILVLGLNPAGDRDYPEHRGLFRYETENAYTGVDWKGAGAGQSKLQKQVRALFESLRTRLRPDCTPDQFAISEVVTANYIPFRSPGEAALHDPDASKAFALRLWADIVRSWRPEVVVCYGSTPFNGMEQLLGSSPRPRSWETRSPLRAVMRLHKPHSGTRLLGLPHLSRFPIFNFPANEMAISAAFDDLCAGVPQ